MWPNPDLIQVDGLAIFVDGSCLAVSLVVSKAVLDAYDDPVMNIRVSRLLYASGKACLLAGLRGGDERTISL